MNKTQDAIAITIPQIFYEVTYQSKRIPGVPNQEDLSLGANCQVFAYELLHVNGVKVPNVRSSELWADTQFSFVPDRFKALDLMLYNATPQAYGAHVAVYIGAGNVMHLSLKNYKAQIIAHSEMLTQAEYAIFIGAKRIIHNAF